MLQARPRKDSTSAMEKKKDTNKNPVASATGPNSYRYPTNKQTPVACPLEKGITSRMIINRSTTIGYVNNLVSKLLTSSNTSGLPNSVNLL